MIYLYESIWWYVAAALCVNMGKIMDMYLEGLETLVPSPAFSSYWQPASSSGLPAALYWPMIPA